MGSREPLPGWRDKRGAMGLPAGHLRLLGQESGWWRVKADIYAGDSADQPLRAAQLAAEDAARAMVADMAAALGARTLIWADAEEGGE